MAKRRKTVTVSKLDVDNARDHWFEAYCRIDWLTNQLDVARHDERRRGEAYSQLAKKYEAEAKRGR